MNSYRDGNNVVVRSSFRLPKDYWKEYPTTAYEIQTAGKHSWLKRLAWWTLQKLKATKQHWGKEHMVTETRMMFDANEAFDKIFVKAQYCMDTCYSRRVEKILVGAEDFANIVNQPDTMKMGAFDFTGRLAEPAKYTDRDRLTGFHPKFTYYQVPVYVIPHMQGILVL